jgi:LPS export ABC transporter protein LptC
MRRWSTLCLVLFIALLAGLAGTVVWRARGRPAVPPAPPPSEADYRITEIHIDETLEGNLRWSLDADRADVYDQRGRTHLRRVTVRVYSQDAVWTVTGDQGILDHDRRDVSVRGNVVVTSDDGLTLRTAALYWRNEDRVLSTDGPVEITRAGTTITGRGLDVRMREQEATLAHDVRVVIRDPGKASLALFPRTRP